MSLLPFCFFTNCGIFTSNRILNKRTFGLPHPFMLVFPYPAILCLSSSLRQNQTLRVGPNCLPCEDMGAVTTGDVIHALFPEWVLSPLAATGLLPCINCAPGKEWATAASLCSRVVETHPTFDFKTQPGSHLHLMHTFLVPVTLKEISITSDMQMTPPLRQKTKKN